MQAFRAATAVIAVACLAVSCGDDTDTTGPSSTTATSSTTSTTTTSTTTTSTTTTTTTTLPGEPFDIGPAAGDVLAVIGVRFDDVLHVRRLPGTDQDVVAELPNLAADFVATGRGRMLPNSIWWEIATADQTVGWVGSSFVAKIGPTFDSTADLVARLGETPQAATMADLGLLVAEAFDTDPDVPTDIVLTVEPAEDGDLGEVTYDVVGLGDDAARALRLHVLGQPLESGAGFGLKTVEATDMCDPTRGPGADGLCA